MSSYKCRPGKWVWGIIPLALPVLGAWFLNTPLMVGKLSTIATAEVEKLGLLGLKSTMDGRDVVLTGTADSKESVQKLVGSLLGAYGVRRVDSSGVTIAKPVVLEKPTVKPSMGNSSRPEITGTWPNKQATTLQVGLAGKSYTLGTDSELSSDDAGNWKLTPSKPIVDGVYDVTVAITDGKKAAAADDSKDEVSIDTTPPSMPTVSTKLTTKEKTPTVSGTYAGADAASLVVSLAGKSYTLGKDDALTVKDNNWSLVPSTDLADGAYDVSVKTADKSGNESIATAKSALTIDTTAPDAATAYVIQGKETKPEISGKWSAGKGDTLTVMLAGTTYVLGKDKELTSSKVGVWTLNPRKPLAEGKHSLTITTSDALGNSREMIAPNAILVDKTAPQAPVVVSTINPTTTPVVAGTWAETAGNNLRVVVSGKVFVLGRDKQLSSDGKGNWKLSLAQPLGEGKHSILVESSDSFGNIARTEKPSVVVVDTTKPDPATINKAANRTGLGKISGTWPESDKNQLMVSVGDQSFKLGTDKELTSDGKGNWALNLTNALKEGVHKVVAIVTDAAGNSSTAQFPAGFIVDRTPPSAPTVTTVLTRQRTPVITGTWNAQQSTGLKVHVAGQTFSSQNKGEITINGDYWSVQPSKPIKDGTYNVVATANDKLGNVSSDTGEAELVIDATSPPAPTVRPIFGTNNTPVIRGTWPQDGENSLAVELDGKAYSIGSGENLKSDGKGNWSLTPAKPLTIGSYDVKVTVADKMGNVSTDVSKGEVWIKAVKKPETKAKPAPVSRAVSKTVPKIVPKAESKTPESTKAAVNCQKQFSIVLAGQNIQFNTNKTTISADSQPLIVKLAKVANACPTATIEISGHTDSRGSAVYNQSLSEGRASAVLDALVHQGVKRNRLRAVGYGETKPIADNKTREGLAKNRRIEFKVDQ